MNKLLCTSAFLLGLLAIAAMGTRFAGSDTVAMAVIAAIAIVYSIGGIELLYFHRATATLRRALTPLTEQSTPPQSLEPWLATLHSSLRNAVRLRIQGERVALPAPAVTPYLVGLLVMLGLLGTFAGMVNTLQGAVFALEGTTELQAIRAGLAAPIAGLSLAFGTSVAGISASAMLGLIATLARRDRILASAQLDSCSATTLAPFSVAYQHQQTLDTLQAQTSSLPEVATQLARVADKLEQTGDSLARQLIANQQQLHKLTTHSLSQLSTALERSVRQHLSASARQAGEAMKPLLQQTLDDIHQATATSQQQLALNTQQHIATLAQGFDGTAQAVAAAWQNGLTRQQSANDTLIEHVNETLNTFNRQLDDTSSTLLHSFDTLSSAWTQRQANADSEQRERWQQALAQTQQQGLEQLIDSSRTYSNELKQVCAAQQTTFADNAQQLATVTTSLAEQWLQSSARMDDLTTTLSTELAALRNEEDSRGRAALERLGALEATVADHLGTLGQALEQPLTRLLETAAQTPRAAAEVISSLRQEATNHMARDNDLLLERQQLVSELNTLASALSGSCNAQREAIEQLVNSATRRLEQAYTSLNNQTAHELSKVTTATDQFAGSAVIIASLGEAFTLAVNLFNDSNNQLIDQLGNIETALHSSTARSDEQMGYYVAQAREIIDQTMLSQQYIITQLNEHRQPENNAAATAVNN